MTEDSQKAANSKRGNSHIKPWLGKLLLAALTAIGMALVGYFTGLIPTFLDPYFGNIPRHEIAVEVIDEKSGKGIDGAEVSISEVGQAENGSTAGLLDRERLSDGDARLLAETASENGKLKVEYTANGKAYRYRQVFKFSDLSTVSLKFPRDFSYDGKGKKPGQVDAGPLKPIEGFAIMPGSNEAVTRQKESLDNAYGEAALSLDDVTAQMQGAREARAEEAAKKSQ